jgi:hypothetical protein
LENLSEFVTTAERGRILLCGLRLLQELLKIILKFSAAGDFSAAAEARDGVP